MNTTDAIEMAISYNQDEPEFSTELVAEIRNGEVFIQTQSYPLNGSGSRMRYTATLLVRTATLGLVAAADPEVAIMNRKRGASDAKMAAWLGTKAYGSEIPQKYAPLS